MWYTVSMSQTPDERRKTFEGLAAKRQEMIVREREKQLARERETDERTSRQKEASLAEQQAASARGEEREAWRQEQHGKRAEELKAQLAAEEERARQARKAAEDEEDRAKRAKRMHDLHDRAVSQKVAARKLQAEHIEEDAAKNVNVQLERDLRDAAQLLERTLEHLTQDRRKKIAQMEDDALRQSKADAERFAVRKKDAEAEGPRSGSTVFQLIAEHKRSVMALQERVADARAKIESEYVRLKDEAVAQAGQKMARLRSVAAQRLHEAQTRHENMDEWIDSHRS